MVIISYGFESYHLQCTVLLVHFLYLGWITFSPIVNRTLVHLEANRDPQNSGPPVWSSFSNNMFHLYKRKVFEHDDEPRRAHEFGKCRALQKQVYS